MTRDSLLWSAAALAAGLLAAAPAQALSMKECGAKYQAAKEAGTLKGQKWNEFRKAECGDEDASEADAAAAVSDDEPAAKPAASGTAKAAGDGAGGPKTPAPKATTAAAPAASGKVVFPTEVSAKHAGESAGKARLNTCVDQYRANKASGGNGDLKWIQKGGGYYSQCNAKLKS